MSCNVNNIQVNILITLLGRACLADLGMATVADSQVLKFSSFSTGPTGGTARWQGPEIFMGTQRQNSAGRKASDMYSFSCACYEVRQCISLMMTMAWQPFVLYKQIFTSREPFFEIHRDIEVIFRVVMEGIRPSCPPPSICQRRGLKRDMWRLMEDCWRAQPTSRPSASQAVDRIRKGFRV